MSQSKDLLIYFAFCALPIASFLLLGYPDVNFYLSLLLVSLVVIVWMHTYRKSGGMQLVEYDHDLSGMSLFLIAGGLAGVLTSATVLVSSFTKSSLYVPTAGLALSVGGLTIPKFWSDVLFQFTLVAPSEECSKLVTQLSMFDWLHDKFGKTIARFASITVPIMFWAVLHTYRNSQYMGEYMALMVGTAFVAGLIMYAVMHYTKSLLGALFVHAAYNAVILYMTTGMS